MLNSDGVLKVACSKSLLVGKMYVSSDELSVCKKAC